MKINLLWLYNNKQSECCAKQPVMPCTTESVTHQNTTSLSCIEILPYINFQKNINNSNNIVSFGSMKKNQFSGVDRLVVEKFAAPIEKFNTNEDFQIWCKERLHNYTDKDFSSADSQITTTRKQILEDWRKSIFNIPEKYSPSICLLAFDGLMRSIKGKDDSLPPVFDEETLDAVIDNINKNTYKQFNFSKEYFLQLRKSIIKKLLPNQDVLNGWLIIPSKAHDPENFQRNVNYLKALSCNTWCTKGLVAQGYLYDGDFHIYFENSEPILGVRFEGNNVVEIQDQTNSSKIPLEHLDIAVKHLIEKYTLSEEAYETMNFAIGLKKKIDNFIAEKFDGKNPNEFSPEEILKRCGVTIKQDEEGFYTLSKYSIDDNKITFADLGINENKKFGKIFKKLQAIEGDANFTRTNVQEMPSLEFIGGDVLLFESQIQSMPILKIVGGTLNTISSNIEFLPSLQEVSGDAYLNNKKITELPSLKVIRGNAVLSKSNIASLPNLQEIGGNACCNLSNITSMDKLEKIGKDAIFSHSKIEKLPLLTSIGGNADFKDTHIKCLPKLNTIGNTADFRDCENVWLPELKNYKKILGSDNIANIDKLE